MKKIILVALIMASLLLCLSLTSCKDTDKNTNNSNSNNIQADKNASTGFEFYPLADGTYELTGIGTCKDTNIVIPNAYKGKSVVSIGNSAFEGCTAITSVVIPEGIKSIGYSGFDGCTRLTSIELPSSLTYISPYAFGYCRSLKSIEIPSGVTYIDITAFDSCTALSDILVGNGSSSYASLDGVLYSKGMDRLVCYPQGKEQISFKVPATVSEIGNNAFANCTRLSSVYIPNSVTHMGHGAFIGCTGLTVYCEAYSVPTDWTNGWNVSSCYVVWGYKQD